MIHKVLTKIFSRESSKGYFFGVLASLSFSLVAMTIKLAKDIPSATIIFSRALISLFFLLPLFFKKKISFKVNKPLLLFMRVIIGLLGMFCFVTASKKLLLVDSVLLVNTSPLFIPLIVLFWLKEKIPLKRALILLVGFIGIMFILRPDFSFFNKTGLIGLASGLLIGSAFVMVRQLSKTEPVERILFYFFAGTILFSIYPLIYTYRPLTKPIEWVLILIIGFGSFCFQYFNTKAYSYAPSTKVSCLGYFSVVFSGFIDWLVWKRVPDLFTLLGITLVVGAGSYIIFHRSVEKKVVS